VKRFHLVSFPLTALVVTACAHTAPPILEEARASYTRAAYGPTAQNAGPELADAAKALSRANTEFDRSPKSSDVDDLAYIALRKVERAESRARLRQLAQQRAAAQAELQKAQAAVAQRRSASQLTAQQEAEAAARRLQEQEARLTQAEETLRQRDAEIAQERAAREQAEQQAREASASLERLGATREEPRGTVLTLSGSLLFASGRSDLLPQARQKLDEVAAALNQAPNQSIEIDGHSDSVGADAYNLQLSTLRAETVRTYLISQGVKHDRVRAMGFGESKPIADNATPDGRANNRRVEIVLQRAPGDRGLGGSGEVEQ